MQYEKILHSIYFCYMFACMKTFETHTDMPLDDRLRRSVAAWRERHGVSARRFGMDALGDPGFVGSHMRGRSVRLQTADRVLAFMGEPPLGPAFRREVEAFLAVTGAKLSVLGGEATGNPSFVVKLRLGSSPRLRTLDRVRAWMAAHTSEDELRAIRARMADTTDMDLFAGTRAPGSFTAQAPTAGAEREGEMRMNGNDRNYLSTREAAAWLGLSPRTLDRYRVSGEGPVFHRFGSRVRYLLADVEAWASARRRVSTSDDGRTRR